MGHGSLWQSLERRRGDVADQRGRFAQQGVGGGPANGNDNGAPQQRDLHGAADNDAQGERDTRHWRGDLEGRVLRRGHVDRDGHGVALQPRLEQRAGWHLRVDRQGDRQPERDGDLGGRQRDRERGRDGEAARRVFVQRRLGHFGRRDRRCRRAQRNADGHGDVRSIAREPAKVGHLQGRELCRRRDRRRGSGGVHRGCGQDDRCLLDVLERHRRSHADRMGQRRPDFQRRLVRIHHAERRRLRNRIGGIGQQMAPRRRRIYERSRRIQQALRRRRAAGAHAACRRAQQRQRGRGVGAAHWRLERQHQLSIFGSARRGEDLQSRADGGRGERRVRSSECLRNRADRLVDRTGEQREFRRADVDCNDCHRSGDSDRRDTDQGRVLQRHGAARYLDHAAVRLHVARRGNRQLRAHRQGDG